MLRSSHPTNPTHRPAPKQTVLHDAMSHFVGIDKIHALFASQTMHQQHLVVFTSQRLILQTRTVQGKHVHDKIRLKCGCLLKRGTVMQKHNFLKQTPANLKRCSSTDKFKLLDVHPKGLQTHCTRTRNSREQFT